MSGGNKAVEIQLQMRQNAEDLHSFMRELENWEADIKRKDEELRTGRVQDFQVRCRTCCVERLLSAPLKHFTERYGGGSVMLWGCKTRGIFAVMLGAPRYPQMTGRSRESTRLCCREPSHLCVTRTTRRG